MTEFSNRLSEKAKEVLSIIERTSRKSHAVYFDILTSNAFVNIQDYTVEELLSALQEEGILKKLTASDSDYQPWYAVNREKSIIEDVNTAVEKILKTLSSEKND